MTKTMHGITFAGCVLLILYPNSSTAKDMYDFLVTRMTCEDSNPSIVTNVTCATRSISRTVKAHNISLVLVTQVNQVFVKINYLQRISNTYRRSIASAEENFCGFRAGTARSILISILWPFLRKTSNIPDKCPASGQINITNLIFEDTYLPPALPEGQARIDIHVRNGPKRLSMILVKFFIEIKPKGAAMLDF